LIYFDFLLSFYPMFWEEVMPTLVGFGTFAALFEEQISDKISHRILSGDQGMIVWWSIRAGVHVEPHSHANEQIVWMLKGKMEFRLGSEQRVCGPDGVVVIPGGMEHEAWFCEDTEVIDFFARLRETTSYSAANPPTWAKAEHLGPPSQRETGPRPGASVATWNGSIYVASKISRRCCARCGHDHRQLGRSAHNPEGPASVPERQRFYRLVRGYGEGRRFTRCRYH
jgi:quercetin dioxygenase-like cupin family protein